MMVSCHEMTILQLETIILRRNTTVFLPMFIFTYSLCTNVICKVNVFISSNNIFEYTII